MMLSSSMSSPFNPLDSLGDLRLSSPPSLYSSSSKKPPTSTTTTARPTTFTRVSRGIPAHNSNSPNLFPTLGTPPSTSNSKPTSSSTSSPSPSYFSLSNSPSSSERTAKMTNFHSHSSNINSNEQQQQRHSQHGLNRFRPSLYTRDTPSDFLEEIPMGVQSSFTAHKRYDRKDLQLDPVLVLLSQDELAEKHVASASSSNFSLYSNNNNSTTSKSPNTTGDSPVDNINNNYKAASKPCPTFTRITNPRTTPTTPTTNTRTGFYRLGGSGSSNSASSTSTSTSLSIGSDASSSSSSLQLQLQLQLQDKDKDKDKDKDDGTMPSLSLSTSSPSPSCAPSPWSPPALSLSSSSSFPTLSSSINNKPSSGQHSLKAPTSLLLPPLSLSPSPPPSSVPSLSSSASSACSSASSSSSPPTSHFLFPTVDHHHHDWWQGLGSPATPATPAMPGLEQGGEGGTGSRTTTPGTGTGFGSCLNTIVEDRPGLLLLDDISSSNNDVLTTTATTKITTPSSHTFYRQQPQSRESLKSDDLLDKDPVVDHLALALNTNNNIGDNSNQNIGVITPLHGNGNINSTPATASTSTRKSYSLARARAPSPPCVVTGFCSISKTPIKSSGEPSPQDFLGEADLPYPLPSTLHDRQTRQRKRAEQLRQLKIREECEARENNNTNNRRKGIRRRGASFSAGMMYSPATSLGLSSPSSSSTNSNSTPSSPALFSDSPRMQSTSSFRSSAWHHHRLSLNQHLQRSPSSPIRGSSSVNNLHLPNRYSTSNIGQLTKDKAIGSLSAPAPAPALPPPRRRVVFDLENIQVFEYDVSGDDWSPSSGPSSPTLPPASTNGRDSYVRYCPPSDCSSSGSSDEETTSPRMPVRNIKSKAVSS